MRGETKTHWLRLHATVLVELVVEEGLITQAKVLACGACGSTYYIARAKALILEEVRTHGAFTLRQVRAKTPGLNPAAFISAALLLKKEGKL